MRQKREKWGENGRKRGANYEWSEWHEGGWKTARNGGETTKCSKYAKIGGGKGPSSCILVCFLFSCLVLGSGGPGEGPARAVIPSLLLGISRGVGLCAGPRCLDCARHGRIGNSGKPSGPIRVHPCSSVVGSNGGREGGISNIQCPISNHQRLQQDAGGEPENQGGGGGDFTGEDGNGFRCKCRYSAGDMPK